MSYAKQMLDTYPRSFNLDASLLAGAIDARLARGWGVAAPVSLLPNT